MTEVPTNKSYKRSPMDYIWGVMEVVKASLQIIVLALTAVALTFVIIWGIRAEYVLDKMNDMISPEPQPAPVEPIPGPTGPWE